MYTHLHTHSYYSFLRGVPSPEALVKAAAAQRMHSLALTDHRFLTGAIEFYAACINSFEINPPVSLIQAQPGILVLLAMDLHGWSNICRLSSMISDGNPHLSFEQLSFHSEGLICLTGGRRGLLNSLIRGNQKRLAVEWLARLNELFLDSLYVEIQEHTAEDRERWPALIAVSRNLKLPIVATHDIHYLHQDQAPLQKTLAAIGRIQPLNGLPDEEVAPPQAYFKTPQEMQEVFKDHPEFLAVTEEIASRCQLDLPLGQPRFPELNLPPSLSPIDLLRRKADQGARQLYGTITPDIRDRLDHELSVIGECGYASLFLIMEEILGYARQQGIPFSSRGSAASSLVAHCLHITSPDPIRLNLYFERFLNPARATPPDIDTDLCSRRRDEVINFVYQRFGKDQVATICTVNQRK
jgi:DNA polymerase III alpha subunit